MAKDVTVYAVAGDRGTILAVAKAHKIPIPFDCQDGECSSCLVKVTHLSPHARHGISLTEKEKEVLRQLGKISREEVRDAEVNDMPPHYRLACQCFVRNEDILVTFEGDDTLPAKAPALSTAAGVYKGGVSINTLEEFLSYAVKVEEDAAVHFEHLAEAMAACGNADVAGLFGQLGGYSRLHLAQAREKCREHKVTVHLPPSTAWPDNQTPEMTTLWAGDAGLSRLGALKAALQGEQRGFDFYYSVFGTTKDATIRAVAKEFVHEETEHVETLKLWIVKEEAAQKSAAQPVAG